MSRNPPFEIRSVYTVRLSNRGNFVDRFAGLTLRCSRIAGQVGCWKRAVYTDRLSKFSRLYHLNYCDGSKPVYNKIFPRLFRVCS